MSYCTGTENHCQIPLHAILVYTQGAHIVQYCTMHCVLVSDCFWQNGVGMLATLHSCGHDQLGCLAPTCQGSPPKVFVMIMAGMTVLNTTKCGLVWLYAGHCAGVAQPPATLVMRYSQAVRRCAVEAYTIAKHELTGTAHEGSKYHLQRRAVQLFREKCPDVQCAQPGRLIKRWGKAWEKRASLLDKPGRGMKPKLSSRVADKCVEILLGGFTNSEGELEPFKDIHHALRVSSRLRRLRGRCGLKPQQFWKNLCKHDRRLRLKSVRMVSVLTDEQKHSRQEGAAKLLRMFTEDFDVFKRAVFIDEKTYWAVPPRRGAFICNIESPTDYLHHPKRDWRAQSRVKVNYICAVNYFTGPLYWATLTGTTDVVTGAKVSQEHLHVDRMTVCGP